MIKRIVSVLILIFLLSGCSGGKIEPRLCGISFRAVMDYYNESYSFEGRISDEGVLTATMTEPQELKNLEFTLDSQGTIVNYKGLTFTPVEGSIPFCRMIDEFYSKISELINEQELTVNSDGAISRGKGAKEFTLTLTPLGLPQTLKMPDERFIVKFYNIQITNEDVNEQGKIS